METMPYKAASLAARKGAGIMQNGGDTQPHEQIQQTAGGPAASADMGYINSDGHPFPTECRGTCSALTSKWPI